MNLAERFPWYDVVSGTELEQGDLLANCPVLVLPLDLAWPLADDALQLGVRRIPAVILTQSCDLVNDKIEEVLLCAHWPLSEVAQRNPFLAGRQGKETVRRGNVPGYHLIAAYEGEGEELRGDLRVVDFRRVYSLPKVFLRRFAEAQGPRLRLLPPYREHLAQAFARFFMRVGLPVDIPPFR
jgi:hypothetical protein